MVFYVLCRLSFKFIYVYLHFSFFFIIFFFFFEYINEIYPSNSNLIFSLSSLKHLYDIELYSIYIFFSIKYNLLYFIILFFFFKNLLFFFEIYILYTYVYILYIFIKYIYTYFISLIITYNSSIHLSDFIFTDKISINFQINFDQEANIFIALFLFTLLSLFFIFYKILSFIIFFPILLLLIIIYKLLLIIKVYLYKFNTKKKEKEWDLNPR